MKKLIIPGALLLIIYKGAFASTVDEMEQGFSVKRNGLPHLVASYKKVLNELSCTWQMAGKNKLPQSQQPLPLPGDLPLTLIPSAGPDSLPMVFLISGDGGWTSFDEGVSEKLAEKGIPVVGLDAQKYFWNKKTPEEAAIAISNAIVFYLKQWNRKSFILAGYSFGGGVAPFIAENFSIPLKESIIGVFCFSTNETADFEIHIADMLNFNPKEKYNVPAELKKINTLNPVCIFGKEEDKVSENLFAEAGAKIITLPGTHHYNNDYNAVADCFVNNMLLKK